MPHTGPYILPISSDFLQKTRYKDSIHCHLDFWFLSTTFIHSYSVIPFVYIYLLPWSSYRIGLIYRYPFLPLVIVPFFYSLVVPKNY